MSRVAAHDFSPVHNMTDSVPTTSKTLQQLLSRVASDCKDPAAEYGHHAVDVGHGSDTSQTAPFILSFKNLSYSVKVRGKGAARGRPGATRNILSDISGEARDGEILAVLGASGSGKSTLIDALANRIERKSLNGTITLNGDVVESKLLKAISSYVMQDDLLFPMLTVEETLMFAAEFRLPQSLSPAKKRARVQALIDQLGLRSSAGTIIGDEGHRGVSGGERRRVSIGIDVVHDPIILFLDEPTSGLDSTSAYTVVKVLQRIARTGSVVVLTVHQPSHRILTLLDCTLFLSGGQAVYNGPPSALHSFFNDFGRPIPEGENRTEYALDLISELENSPGGITSLVEFNKAWATWPQTSFKDKATMSLKEAISESMSKGKLMSGGKRKGAGCDFEIPSFTNPMWAEIASLTRRAVTNTTRQPELFGMRIGTVLITGILLATVFWRLDDTPKGAQERLGFIAFAVATTFYTSADALPIFIMERFIFMRETAHNAYRRTSYVLCNSLVAIPPLVILSMAFAVTTFWAVGLSGGLPGFFFYTLMIFASYWSGCSFVTFLSAVVPHVILGYILVVAILAYFLLFSGFFINRDRIPNYWIWFHYISLIKYSYEGVLRNEFQDPNRCFVRGVELFDFTPLAQLPEDKKVDIMHSISDALGVPVTSSTCVTGSTDILKSQGITQLSKWSCLWITFASGFFFRFLFYIAVVLGSKNKRR